MKTSARPSRRRPLGHSGVLPGVHGTARVERRVALLLPRLRPGDVAVLDVLDLDRPTAQVLVVTHLPQVAAYADRHVVVEKSSDGTITTSGLTVLDPEARERELSRMFAGVDESDTALAHARELLETAAPGRALS